jgi:hypothetical protein
MLILFGSAVSFLKEKLLGYRSPPSEEEPPH